MHLATVSRLVQLLQGDRRSHLSLSRLHCGSRGIQLKRSAYNQDGLTSAHTTVMRERICLERKRRSSERSGGDRAVSVRGRSSQRRLLVHGSDDGGEGERGKSDLRPQCSQFVSLHKDHPSVQLTCVTDIVTVPHRSQIHPTRIRLFFRDGDLDPSSPQTAPDGTIRQPRRDLPAPATMNCCLFHLHHHVRGDDQFVEYHSSP